MEKMGARLKKFRLGIHTVTSIIYY
jgi:hypothetical protein